jgi:MurNAc alpha-1-phosphate uridylyltransferase
MKAILLAAGRGERLRPLTDHTPKPLMPVRGKPIIEWQLDALARAGANEVVVNTAWLEEQFPLALGDGSRWGLRIHYSKEGRDHGGALETAGGIAKALPWLGEVFWVVSADVYTPGFEFDAAELAELPNETDLKLWLVPNPAHHPQGDFALDANGRLQHDGARHTWSSIGVFRASLFQGVAVGQRLPLRPLLDQSVDAGRALGTLWAGAWSDVGTAERRAARNAPG